MRKLLAFLMSVALGGVLVAGAYEFHVVRTPKGIEFVRKQAPDWRDAYVDVRGWTSRDWAGRPRLVRNLTGARREDIIESSSSVPVPPPWFKSISLSRDSDPDAEEATGDSETESDLGPEATEEP